MMKESVWIHGAGSEMQGVGRLSDGRAVFVPGALPDEYVEIEITRDTPRFCEARLLRVLNASAERRESVCAYYGKCGGCSARHMDYACTLKLKRQRVYDALARIGGVEAPNVLETIGSPDLDRCRNKAEYAMEMRNGQLKIGCFAPKSHRVIPIQDCLLQRRESVKLMNWLAEHLPAHPCAPRIRYLVTRVNRSGQMQAVLCADAPVIGEVKRLCAELLRDVPEVKSLYFCKLKMRPSHALDGECTLIAGQPSLHDRLLGLDFELSPQSFFQVNPVQTEVLYQKALDAAGLHEGCNLRIVDAYCGVGSITLAAAQLAKFALGVEIVAPAIENARRNARSNGLEDKTRFVCADAAREIPKRMAAGEHFDAAIVDPPRKGVEDALLHALADAEIPRIAYVSCNPSTLARDIKLLSSRGYRMDWAQPVDMFPWTEHVETVALLQK